jgi:hypothetical protein
MDNKPSWPPKKTDMIKKVIEECIFHTNLSLIRWKRSNQQDKKIPFDPVNVEGLFKGWITRGLKIHYPSADVNRLNSKISFNLVLDPVSKTITQILIVNSLETYSLASLKLMMNDIVEIFKEVNYDELAWQATKEIEEKTSRKNNDLQKTETDNSNYPVASLDLSALHNFKF